MFEALPAGLERCKLGVFDQHLGTLTTLNSTLTYDADGRLTMSTTFVTHEVLNQPPPRRTGWQACAKRRDEVRMYGSQPCGITSPLNFWNGAIPQGNPVPEA